MKGVTLYLFIETFHNIANIDFHFLVELVLILKSWLCFLTDLNILLALLKSALHTVSFMNMSPIYTCNFF